MDRKRILEPLDAVGAHLEAAGDSACLVDVGGAALSLRGWAARTTDDVDVIASWTDGRPTKPRLEERLRPVIRRVARDFGVQDDWMNDTASPQLDLGLPPAFDEELEWREFRSLRIGIVGRRALLSLKLFAATDQGSASVHAQDLAALAPTNEELAAAAAWVKTQDILHAWPAMVEETVAHVVARRASRR